MSAETIPRFRKRTAAQESCPSCGRSNCEPYESTTPRGLKTSRKIRYWRCLSCCDARTWDDTLFAVHATGSHVVLDTAERHALALPIDNFHEIPDLPHRNYPVT